MSAGCFVHAIFGDFRIPNYQSVLDEVSWCLGRPHQPEPTLWYCYGEANRDFLAGLGLRPTMMSREPFSRFGSLVEERSHHYNTIRFGSSIWRHKYPAVRDALSAYPAAVWLDLDTVLQSPLPADFWDRMAKGAAFQATLQQNFKRRAGWRGEKNEPRKTPAGACLYFRGTEAVEKLMAIYAEKPHEWDLVTLARLTDDLMGGWKGSEQYKALGYEPYCHSLGRFEKRQVHKPEAQMFVTEWRKPRLTKSGPSESPYMLGADRKKRSSPGRTT